ATQPTAQSVYAYLYPLISDKFQTYYTPIVIVGVLLSFNLVGMLLVFCYQWLFTSCLKCTACLLCPCIYYARKRHVPSRRRRSRSPPEPEYDEVEIQQSPPPRLRRRSRVSLENLSSEVD